MVPAVTGEYAGTTLADVDVILDRLAELSGQRHVGADNEKALIAKVIAFSIDGLEREHISVRVEADMAANEWYVPLREATDRAVALVVEHWKIVGTLAARLVEVKQIHGPQLIAFLDELNCPTPGVEIPWLHHNPFRRNPPQ
jgi:glutathione S-transferase